MAALVQSVTVLHPGDNNANTSAASDMGPTRDYKRAPPSGLASAACIQPAHNSEGGIGEILYEPAYCASVEISLISIVIDYLCV